MDKTVGQVMAERKAGKELPFDVVFFGGAFVRACEHTYHETEDEARAQALLVLGQLRNRDAHPATIRGPGLPDEGLTIA